jgi:hypothetical protein
MVDVVAPLRSEAIFDEFGNFTIRYYEYFEGVGNNINTLDSVSDIFSSLNMSAGVNSSFDKRISSLEDNQFIPDNGQIAALIRRVSDIELIADTSTDGKLAALDSKIDQTDIDARRYALLVS